MKSLRLLLLPVSLLYGSILSLRHLLYDLGVFKSKGDFSVPVICIGNLNLGGTGKTPFTEFLIEKLGSRHQIAVLSRGYGRKTKGYLLADPQCTAEEIGDEPLQIYRHFSDRISLAVCEDRCTGVEKLLKDRPETTLIILDDAFQHRKIRADINILLTPYSTPFFADHLIPTGDLRDLKSAANRADVVIFTKSPAIPDSKLKEQLPVKLSSASWFSSINYLDYRSAFSGEILASLPDQLLVVTGIAKPEYLMDQLRSEMTMDGAGNQLELLTFPDHHKYTEPDLIEIATLFDTFAGAQKAILTTEKDWVKLAPLIKEGKEHWILAPIRFSIQQEDELLQAINEKLAAISANR